LQKLVGANILFENLKTYILSELLKSPVAQIRKRTWTNKCMGFHTALWKL